MKINGKNTNIIEVHCNGRILKLRCVRATRLDELAKEKPAVIEFGGQRELWIAIETLKDFEMQVKRTAEPIGGEYKDDVCSSGDVRGDSICADGYLFRGKRKI